jgi:hypothetical protein
MLCHAVLRCAVQAPSDEDDEDSDFQVGGGHQHV